MPEWTVGWAPDAWLGYDICEAGTGYKRIEANHVYIYIARYSVGETSRLSSQLSGRRGASHLYMYRVSSHP